MEFTTTREGAMRTYFIDKIDDEDNTIVSETITAANDDAAKNEARNICRDKGWDAAEVWDKDADIYIDEVRP